WPSPCWLPVSPCPWCPNGSATPARQPQSTSTPTPCPAPTATPPTSSPTSSTENTPRAAVAHGLPRPRVMGGTSPPPDLASQSGGYERSAPQGITVGHQTIACVRSSGWTFAP